MTGCVFYRCDFKGAFPGHVGSEFTVYFLILMHRRHKSVGQTFNKILIEDFNRKLAIVCGCLQVLHPVHEPTE